MEALKQRLSALKANAANDGGVDHIAKVQAWKDWKEGASGKDIGDLLTWALGTLTDDTDLPSPDNDELTLRQLITDGMGATANSYLDQAIAVSGNADKAAGEAAIC